MNDARLMLSAIHFCRFPISCLLAGAIVLSSVKAQSPASKPAETRVTRGSSSRYQPDRFAGKAGRYYSMVWGVDSLSVKAVESGELIRFSYRVLDPTKAAILNNKKVDAFLISPAAGVKLVIPSLEKVGQLRQSNTPVAGTSYWMAFSNPHGTVKRGDWVDVEIGQFHAEGLVVE